MAFLAGLFLGIAVGLGGGYYVGYREGRQAPRIKEHF